MGRMQNKLHTLSYIPLCWGLGSLCQILLLQPWIMRAQQLQELSLVWGLSHKSCKRQKVKAQLFCSSYHGLCFPKLQSLILAGALQIPFGNEMLVLHCLTRTEKGTTNTPKTHLMQHWEANVRIFSTLLFWYFLTNRCLYLYHAKGEPQRIFSPLVERDKSWTEQMFCRKPQFMT